MSANSIVPHVQGIGQEASPNTNLYGIAPGKYLVTIGNYQTIVYGKNEIEGRAEMMRVIEEINVAESKPEPVAWESCVDCGYAKDVGEPCPACAGELIFASGIKWEVSQ